VSQINQFRSLAQSSGARKPVGRTETVKDIEVVSNPRESTGERVRDGLSRFLGIFVSIYEVGRTTIKVFFLSLPILGPIGLIVYNLDFKGATQKAAQKSIAEQLGIAGMVAYAGSLFGNMGKAPMVFTTAAGLVKGGKAGDLPQAGEPDLKSLFDAELPKGGLSDKALTPEEPAGPTSAVEAGSPAKADPKKAAPAKKLSPATVEKNDANDVMALLAKAEADYRSFPQADAAFGAFMQRYGKSKFLASLQQKRDDVARIPPRAMPERAGLGVDSKISGARLHEDEAREVAACLKGLNGLNAVVLVRKSVTIQSALPAYVALADTAKSDDAGERLGYSKSISACFAKRMAVGSLAVEFWGDPAVRKVAPQAAGTPSSLVFRRG
jgi:hypothetical protein